MAIFKMYLLLRHWWNNKDRYRLWIYRYLSIAPQSPFST